MDKETEEKKSATIANKKAYHEQVKSLLAVSIVTSLLFGMLGGYAFSKIEGNGGISGLPAGSVLRKEDVQVTVNSNVSDIVKKVSPSVVSIAGEHLESSLFGTYSQKSSGTGFIVNANGLVMTNKHVVEGVSGNFTVYTNDGTEYTAKIKATDPVYDIAFLELNNAKGLKSVDLGDSDVLQVGEPVVAIGNALGQYQNTVTDGIISGIGRALPVGDSERGSVSTLDNVLQTDAAINPGNSGGPLVNRAGQVIGINTAIDQSGQNIGFAIPINVGKTALASVEKNGYVSRPVLGISYIGLTKDLASRNKLSVSEGAMIYSGTNTPAIKSGSSADKAGLKEGDIITKINNDKINSNHSLTQLIQKYNAGDNITLTVLRDNKEIGVIVKLGEIK
ncbi:MAG: protease Do [candidate division CPR2 bacterium GW2011_GWC2_39_10]|uniref:Protease Do n=1 Tax=candidate division CPR2 bacterium GW2011_GWC2_39_10 TaxID=1618345 RepID=A0A0G0LTK4_UNCC2|nr:MAG: protease Do [candidate division CPR2 bacterium GW2011_GWC2_39_10]